MVFQAAKRLVDQQDHIIAQQRTALGQANKTVRFLESQFTAERWIRAAHPDAELFATLDRSVELLEQAARVAAAQELKFKRLEAMASVKRMEQLEERNEELMQKLMRLTVRRDPEELRRHGLQVIKKNIS